MGAIVKHLSIIVGIAALIVLSITYPFLPGRHDRLAVPLSTMAQVFGILGLPLVPVGLWWLAMPKRGLPLRARAVRGHQDIRREHPRVVRDPQCWQCARLTLVVWVYILIRLLPRLKRARLVDGDPFNPVPLYWYSASDRAHLAAGPCRSRHQVEQSAGDRERDRIDQ